MNDTPKVKRPTPEEVEAFQRLSLDLLESIIECGLQHEMGEEFMNTLQQLVINPVRKELR